MTKQVNGEIIPDSSSFFTRLGVLTEFTNITLLAGTYAVGRHYHFIFEVGGDNVNLYFQQQDGTPIEVSWNKELTCDNGKIYEIDITYDSSDNIYDGMWVAKDKPLF